MSNFSMAACKLYLFLACGEVIHQRCEVIGLGPRLINQALIYKSIG